MHIIVTLWLTRSYFREKLIQAHEWKLIRPTHKLGRGCVLMRLFVKVQPPL